MREGGKIGENFLLVKISDYAVFNPHRSVNAIYYTARDKISINHCHPSVKVLLDNVHFLITCTFPSYCYNKLYAI